MAPLLLSLPLIAVAWAESSPMRPSAQVMILTLLFYTGLLFLENSGLLWQEQATLCWAVSGWLTDFFGVREQLGPVWVGWSGWMFGASLLLAGWMLGTWKRIFLLVWLVILFLGLLLSISLRQVWVLPVLMGLLAGGMKWNSLSAATQHRRIRLGCGLLVMTFGMVIGYCWGIPATRARPQTLGIVTGGLKTLDILQGAPKRAMEPQQAAFGGLRRLLPLYGWQVRVVPEAFTAKDLSGLSVLCVINLTKKLNTNQRTALERFVREGGRLLVLGDHTDIGGMMRPLNNLLKFTTIRFRFDGAPIRNMVADGAPVKGATTPFLKFEIFEPESEREIPKGTVSRANATCPCCNVVLPAPRVRAQLAAQRGGADMVFDEKGNRISGAMLLAVVTLKDGEQGRRYRLPTERDYAAVRAAQRAIAKLPDGAVPNEPLPPIGTLGFRVQRYGMTQWGDLFTARQKLALVMLKERVRQLPESTEQKKAVKIVLASCIDKLADLSKSVSKNSVTG